MEVRQAVTSDIADLVKLQEQCHIGNINESEKEDGFLNTVLDEQLLTAAITNDNSVFVAVSNSRIVGLAVCGSWDFWSFSPSLSARSEKLPNLESQCLSRDNSYFWGPVCISKSHRGKGVFELLFNESKKVMSNKYPFIYTYVHQDNKRSYAAHTRKSGFIYTQDFILNDQCFKELVRTTM